MGINVCVNDVLKYFEICIICVIKYTTSTYMQIKVYKSKQKYDGISCFLSEILLHYIPRMRSKSTEITRGTATAVLAFRDAGLCSLRIARIVKGLR